MELHREIRAFYIKLPQNGQSVTQEIIDNLWNLSRDIPVIATDIGSDHEVMIHSAFEFTLESWNNALRFLRSAMSVLNAKSGYLAVRKIIITADALKTEIEGYKVTKRGVYNIELTGPADFIEDIIRFSGNNKRLQQIGAMEKLFRFIEGQENNDADRNG